MQTLILFQCQQQGRIEDKTLAQQHYTKLAE
jgi:hypothetical protein